MWQEEQDRMLKKIKWLGLSVTWQGALKIHLSYNFLLSERLQYLATL